MFDCACLLATASLSHGHSTSHGSLSGARANPQLTGVNNGWVGALGLFCDVNRDAKGHPGSWLPPNINGWVNKSDPFNSKELTELLGGLQLGSYRYPGGSIGNCWNWTSDAFSPLANDS